MCNGSPDPSDCSDKIDIADCGTILFGAINASSLCPTMCNACAETTPAPAHAADPAAVQSNVGVVVGIVLPLVTLIGIIVALVMMRKKEQGRRRAPAHTRGPPARNNPVFSDKVEAPYAEPVAVMNALYVEPHANRPAVYDNATLYTEPSQRQSALYDAGHVAGAAAHGAVGGLYEDMDVEA